VEGYVYDQSFTEERARLAGMEAQWDAGTFRHLNGLGLAADAACWEIGGGAGSVAAWLAERAGQVLVTDIEPQFVEPLAGGNVSVERHDVVNDPLPETKFDLIHARLVLEHLPQRDQVLDRLVDALRPGGCLLIEDYDWGSFGIEPQSKTIDRVAGAVIELMVEAGFDPRFGRRLLRELWNRDFVDTGAEGRMLVMATDHPGAAFYRLSLSSLRGAVVSGGRVTETEADEVLGEMERAGRCILSPTMVAAWGRRAV